MKKRTLALLLAAIMLLGLLSGCGGNDDADAGDSGAENSGTETLAANQTIQVHWAAENFHSFDNNKNYAAEEIRDPVPRTGGPGPGRHGRERFSDL